MHMPSKAIAGGVLLIATVACGLVAPGTVPELGVSTIVAETLNAATLVAPPPAESPAASTGLAVTFPGGSMVIPTGLAGGISSETVAAVLGEGDGSAPWWGIGPEHVRVTFQDYVLQAKFHEPQIIVFPAAEYAAANESAAANIQTLQDVLSNPASVPESTKVPHITFFNAGPVFQSQVAVVPFRGGYGIRALTEYAQYAAPVNNNDMFYHFQGLTSDGTKYIVAILPVTAPLLQVDSAPSSLAPVGGVTYPDFSTADPAAFGSYYAAVSDLLNSTAESDFTPSLTALDALIGSLSVGP
jgi:hypothetical protein